jgi:hypothetical protein
VPGLELSVVSCAEEGARDAATDPTRFDSRIPKTEIATTKNRKPAKGQIERFIIVLLVFLEFDAKRLLSGPTITKVNW